MRKYFENPDFSLTKFCVMMALAVAHLILAGYMVSSKSFRAWLANADWRWSVILVIALSVVALIGWLIESGNSRLRTYAVLVVGIVASVTVALNWVTVADAFNSKNAPASIAILAYLAVMAFIGYYMATSKSKSKTHTRGGA